MLAHVRRPAMGRFNSSFRRDMQLIGFSIAKDFIALERGSDYFDLHNNFDFRSMSYNPMDRTLELLWHRSTGDWVKSTDPPELLLSFRGVHLFKSHERDPEVSFTDDGCLYSIGFIWDHMLAEMRGYAYNQSKEGCSHLNIAFASGFSIKIGAESALLHVTSSA
jgi:hypothetical protein